MKLFYYYSLSKFNSLSIFTTVFSLLIFSFGKAVCGESYVKSPQGLTGVWTDDYSFVFEVTPYSCIVSNNLKANQIEATYPNGKIVDGNTLFIVQKGNYLISPPVILSSSLISNGKPYGYTYYSGKVSKDLIVFNQFPVAQSIVLATITYTGTISADGNKIVGIATCKPSMSSQILQEKFQLSRRPEDQLNLINLLTLFSSFPSFP
jgi:hypothetical protein